MRLPPPLTFSSVDRVSSVARSALPTPAPTPPAQMASRIRALPQVARTLLIFFPQKRRPVAGRLSPPPLHIQHAVAILPAGMRCRTRPPVLACFPHHARPHRVPLYVQRTPWLSTDVPDPGHRRRTGFATDGRSVPSAHCSTAHSGRAAVDRVRLAKSLPAARQSSGRDCSSDTTPEFAPGHRPSCREVGEGW